MQVHCSYPMIDRLQLSVNDLDLTLLQNQGHM